MRDNTTMRFERIKHYRGCYRIRADQVQSVSDAKFGQIKKLGPKRWSAELRNTLTGDLYQHAGIWNSLRDAQDAVEYDLFRYFSDKGLTVIRG